MKFYTKNSKIILDIFIRKVLYLMIHIYANYHNFRICLTNL